MAIVSTRRLGNGLAIRNLWLFVLNHHLIVVLKTPFEGAEVELTLTSHDNLFELFRLLNYPSSVLLVHTCEESCQLLCISLINRFDCTAIFRIRIGDSRILVLAVFCIEGITCAGVFEFHSSSDVTSRNFLYRDADVTCYRIELRDTLFGTAINI